MKRRKWDPKMKALVVLEGLKGRPVGGLCTEHQISYNNPKGNADTERMMRSLKEEFIWLREWRSPLEFIEQFNAWVEHYNNG